MPRKNDVPRDGVHVKQAECECGNIFIDDEIIRDGEVRKCEIDGDVTGCGRVYEFEWTGMEPVVVERGDV